MDEHRTAFRKSSLLPPILGPRLRRMRDAFVIVVLSGEDMIGIDG